MSRLCETCIHSGYCLIRKPINIRGKEPNKPEHCLLGTCLLGEMSAKSSMNGKVRHMPTDYGTQKLYRFGSEHKPTDRSSRFARYVNPDGWIFFHDMRKGNPKFTGQTIDLY